MMVEILFTALTHRHVAHASRSEHRAPLVHDWSQVAACESTQRWHIATPPFYGGLQITLDAWRAFGGDRYAGRPDLATRAQQIRVAEHILAGQGIGAWPVCGSRLAVGA